MENIDFATLFQGIGTMMESGWVGRVCSNLWL